MSATHRELYAQHIRGMRRLVTTLQRRTAPPDVVARVVEQALTSTGGVTTANFDGLLAGTDYHIEVETLLDGAKSAPVSESFTTGGEQQVTCEKQPGDICTVTVGDALRVKVFGASGWAIIHYSAGNYQMLPGSEGEFYYDILGVTQGQTVNAWFTVNTQTGAYDTPYYELSHD